MAPAPSPEAAIAIEERRREDRLRRRARRQGLRLQKSRTDGSYHLVDPFLGTLEVWGAHSGFGLSLDEIDLALAEVDS